MSPTAFLRVPELLIAGFLVPWGLVIGTLGFLAAWLVTLLLERTTLTRHIWHLPLFFIALAILFGSLLGLALAP
jgi:hypothetical protein